MARAFPFFRLRLIWLLFLAPFFFITYNLANRYAAQLSEVDSLVFVWEQHMPFWAWTIIPYWSIDLLYGLSLLLPRTTTSIHRLGLRLLSVQVICVTCFMLWPLHFSFTRPDIGGVFGQLFDILMGFDKPFNQAPSLHIALLVVIWSCFREYCARRWHWLIHGWFFLIGLSVLTTWQHHFIDLPTGILVGCFCCWLWPFEEKPVYRMCSLEVFREPANPLLQRRLKLGLAYLAGAILTAALAVYLQPWGLWLFWPVTSLSLVALNYLLIGADGFQKRSEGRFSLTTQLLFMPYTAAAWLNSRGWTFNYPNASQVDENVYLGRLPSAREAARYCGNVDLCAELPLGGGRKAKPADYCSVPVLDLTVPSIDQCLRAADHIERYRQSGTVLVCCALGVSRSAMAVAAWLLCYRPGTSVNDAITKIETARPQIKLSDKHRRVLEQLASHQSARADKSISFEAITAAASDASSL